MKNLRTWLCIFVREPLVHAPYLVAGGSVGVFVGTNGNSYSFGIEGSVNASKGQIQLG
ncbi:hypothetical protein [Rodentibacter caecimuris]|uniref:hypothetical protein n=1 Tax=Rodentibacter caecimuris TaxID=1796644 RepID=UPI001313E5EE|nr:hypothetical protein [Rodentibacter heylii]